MSAVIALAYLLCVAASLTALAVALRHRREPTRPLPSAPAPARPAADEEADIRAILTAAARLAARFTPAA